MIRIRQALLVMLLAPALAAADLYVVIVEGLGGETRYTDALADQVGALERAANGMTSTGNVRAFRTGEFTRDDVVAHFEQLGSAVGQDDRLAMFLVGHGSYDDHEYKFNIGGPDLTGADIAELLDAAPAGSQLLVNTSSASGAMRERVRKDSRVVVVATRSGVERHATHFGGFFVDALTSGAADIDKNGVISAEEAFQYAERGVSDHFERDGTLATEHPQIDGDLAGRFSVARLAPVTQDASDPALTRMIGRRDALNAEIDALRLRRESMTAEDYQSELLETMLELATLEDEIERREEELGNED